MRGDGAPGRAKTGAGGQECQGRAHPPVPAGECPCSCPPRCTRRPAAPTTASWQLSVYSFLQPAACADGRPWAAGRAASLGARTRSPRAWRAAARPSSSSAAAPALDQAHMAQERHTFAVAAPRPRAVTAAGAAAAAAVAAAVAAAPLASIAQVRKAAQTQPRACVRPIAQAAPQQAVSQASVSKHQHPTPPPPRPSPGAARAPGARLLRAAGCPAALRSPDGPR